MADKEFRQKMLANKKTERIIFAATPELKAAIEAVAKDQCISASAVITNAIISELAKQEEILEIQTEKKA